MKGIYNFCPHIEYLAQLIKGNYLEARFSDHVHEELVAHQVWFDFKCAEMLEVEIACYLIEVISQVKYSFLKFLQLAFLLEPAFLKLERVESRFDLLKLFALDAPDSFSFFIVSKAVIITQVLWMVSMFMK